LSVAARTFGGVQAREYSRNQRALDKQQQQSTHSKQRGKTCACARDAAFQFANNDNCVTATTYTAR
jgi:cobyrinic acid a,c-diamide synthase